MSLGIPQKKGGEKKILSSVELASLVVTLAVNSKHPFTKAFRKDDSIWASQGENHCSWKSGKQFLARANCQYIRVPGGNTICPPDRMYSGYLESDFI